MTALFASAGVLASAALRYVNARVPMALAAAAVLALTTGAAVVAFYSVKGSIIESRDLKWQTRIAIARLGAEVAQRKRETAAQAAADREREIEAADRTTLAERIADLETQIRAAEADSGDPVVFPQALARSLNR